jgi:hypothetical protein
VPSARRSMSSFTSQWSLSSTTASPSHFQFSAIAATTSKMVVNDDDDLQISCDGTVDRSMFMLPRDYIKDKRLSVMRFIYAVGIWAKTRSDPNWHNQELTWGTWRTTGPDSMAVNETSYELSVVACSVGGASLHPPSSRLGSEALGQLSSQSHLKPHLIDLGPPPVPAPNANKTLST